MEEYIYRLCRLGASIGRAYSICFEAIREHGYDGLESIVAEFEEAYYV